VSKKWKSPFYEQIGRKGGRNPKFVQISDLKEYSRKSAPEISFSPKNLVGKTVFRSYLLFVAFITFSFRSA
jgi:hypothetical protein